MERIIKFRGKRSYTGEWIYGSYYKKGALHFIVNEISVTYTIDPATLGQFTGVHDKNGKEIYEGDVVEWTGRKYGIRYGSWCWMKYYLPNTDNSFAFDYPTAIESEIIGSIHSNPELL